MTREEQVRIVRDSLQTSDVDGNPATFDPPEWALRAVERAYNFGHQRGEQYRQREIDDENRKPGYGCSEAFLYNGGR